MNELFYKGYYIRPIKRMSELSLNTRVVHYQARDCRGNFLVESTLRELKQRITTLRSEVTMGDK